MNDALIRSAVELSDALRRGEVSASAVTVECLKHISDTVELNNFITVCSDEATEAAEQADGILKSGRAAGPLCGVPIAVKDNISTRGIRTTCASRLLRDNVPSEDAAVIQKLKAAGAVIIGKTNMDEFAFGSTDENSAFGCVKNARDVGRSPGGSSGGSANAVAAGQVPMALGTDTGGSVRQPAAFCGVVGLKPTHDAIDISGMIGCAPSFEHIGTFTNDCDDAALLFNAIKRDGVYPILPQDLSGSIVGKTVGVADEFISHGMVDECVRREFLRATDTLRRLGATVRAVSVPSFSAGLSTYHVLSSAEAVGSFCELLTEHPSSELLGAEVRRRLVTGAFVTDSVNRDLYIKAAKVRAVLQYEYMRALNGCDALICPTSPTVATSLGGCADPDKNHMCDVFLAPVSLTGLPAVSVPFGSENGLPIGMQIIGGYNAECAILNIGKALMAADRA